MNFLDAFQNAYEGGGAGSAPTTTRELLDQGREWVDSGGEAAALLAGARALRAQAGRSRQETEKDLRTHALDPELREPMESSRDGFAGMEQALLGLEEALEAQDRDGAAWLLDSLEASARQVGDAGRAMKAWLEAPVARCPRCGAREGPVCEKCGLDLLVPDPQHATDRSLKSAVLPGTIAAVYRAYTAVISGETPLGSLYASLDALEAEMKEKRGHAALYARRTDSEAAERLVGTVDEVLAGAARMRQVAETRRMRDLNAGWELIFGSGQRVEPDVSGVLQEGGRQGPSEASWTADRVELGGGE